jgi:uncharacterized damage-inducible protein DinB
MTRNEALAQRLAEMFDGHAWHGPPLLATLRDLTPAQAAATPIAGAHSIWALALHIDTWQRVVTRRLAGDNAPVSDDENFPAVPPPDPTAWRAVLSRLAESDAALRAAVIACDPERLDPASDHFDELLHRNVLGAISHLAWHAGQIAILRRAQGLEATAPEA